mmetsp:Transcript_57761/g.169011  ORF Transcript_57761/g.169011 Transcript_57761/m.169011 type:complete len:269 (-) Transcript_57761:46-852(-)
MSRYWSDEAYGKFYQSSMAERGLVNKTAACGEDAAGLKEPDRAQFEHFQAAFAEWSAGPAGLKRHDFQRFLLQLGLELSAAHVRSLWCDVAATEDAPRITYDEALLAYRQALSTPLDIRAAAGAKPPGRRPPGWGEGDLVAPQDEEEQPAWQYGGGRGYAAGPGARMTAGRAGSGRGLGGGPLRDEGLCIPLEEARELLLAELPHCDAEALLARFAARGSVPQAVLFELLVEEAGVLDDSGAAVPSTPALRKPALQAPALPGARPVLA